MQSVKNNCSYSSFNFKLFDAWKDKVVLLGISIVSPVWGFLPFLAKFFFCLKVPKSLNLISFPFSKTVTFTAAMSSFSISEISFLLKLVCSCKCSIKSSLFQAYFPRKYELTVKEENDSAYHFIFRFAI